MFRSQFLPKNLFLVCFSVTQQQPQYPFAGPRWGSYASHHPIRRQMTSQRCLDLLAVFGSACVLCLLFFSRHVEIGHGCRVLLPAQDVDHNVRPTTSDPQTCLLRSFSFSRLFLVWLMLSARPRCVFSRFSIWQRFSMISWLNVKGSATFPGVFLPRIVYIYWNYM